MAQISDTMERGGNFPRVGVSVSGCQTHGESNIVHPGLLTNKAVPATPQNCAKGCVTHHANASLVSQTSRFRVGKVTLLPGACQGHPWE